MVPLNLYFESISYYIFNHFFFKCIYNMIVNYDNLCSAAYFMHNAFICLTDIVYTYMVHEDVRMVVLSDNLYNFRKRA